jgi:hypothetical protein
VGKGKGIVPYFFSLDGYFWINQKELAGSDPWILEPFWPLIRGLKQFEEPTLDCKFQRRFFHRACKLQVQNVHNMDPKCVWASSFSFEGLDKR